MENGNYSGCYLKNKSYNRFVKIKKFWHLKQGWESGVNPQNLAKYPKFESLEYIPGFNNFFG